MKNIGVLISAVSVIVFMTSCYDSIVGNPAGHFDKKSVQKYQKELKEYYENPATTPLKEGEREDFRGITFFPVSEQYFVRAKVETIVNGDTVSMPTSAQKVKRFVEYAKLNFTIDRKELTLTAYIPVLDPDVSRVEQKVFDLFIPFKDETNGFTSYGAGRYIDIKSNDIVNNEVGLDFNKAYNPYCAYSIFYNCPIPPYNNHLKIEIPAGVSYED